MQCQESICVDSLFGNCSFGNVREIWITLGKVWITLLLDKGLIRTFSPGGPFAVSSIKLVDDIHSFKDNSERRESLLVQESIPLLSRVDKDLCGTGVWSSSSKDHSSPTVGNFDWIVWNTRRSPLAHDIGITVNSELSNESWKDAEEPAVIIESVGYEFLKIEKRKRISWAILLRTWWVERQHWTV